MADPPGQVKLGDGMSEAPSGSVATELSKHTSPLSMIQTCLSALLNSDSDGRVRVQSNADGTTWWKSTMLNLMSPSRQIDKVRASETDESARSSTFSLPI